MRTLYSKLQLLILLVTFFDASSQVPTQYSIPLKTGYLRPSPGIDPILIDKLNKTVEKEPVAAILQFQNIPTEKEKQNLLLNGIRLLNYLGGNAYVASIHKPVSTDILTHARTRSLLSIAPDEKINFFLKNVTKDTTVNATIFSFIAADDAISRLNEKGFLAEKSYNDYPVLKIHVAAGRLNELANFEFIEYIEPVPPPPTELNYKSTAGTRANILHTPNYNLNGEGIVFQVNEVTGYPQNHIDLRDRSIDSKVSPTGDYHSTHVHGIIAGAGLINELYKGYAPKARFNTGSMLDYVTDIRTYGAALTNNSYASGSICSKANPSADYVSSMIADMQAMEFKSLIHVMAAGNSGNVQCSLYPFGFNTVYSGYQSSKSTLTVGATFSNGVLADFSSKGPGRGRFKPEIVAPGANIISTAPYNSYGNGNGTSMSAPAVAGGLGLLYQRYQQLYGTKPENALMKPLLCNTATDLGPAGPDYGYGFGFMNLNRAIQVLDAGNFYKDSAANQQTKTKTISVPQGLAKLKVMLYWQDPPASAFGARPLVNDLDIKLTTPNGITVLPFVLDTLPSHVANLARPGIDHINNIEQVVIDAPAAGNYLISVEGYEIGEGNRQSFYVVYDLVPNTVQLTFPANDEVLAPNDNISVQWDSWGDPSSRYTLEFSTDNGVSWQTISSTISATSFDWTVPSLVTNEARLRITRNNDGITSSPGSFRIIGVPAIKLSPSQCPGSITLEWQKINGASDYEVMWYRNGDMVPALITSDTSFIFRNLSEDSVYYVTVRSRNNGQAGRRAYALSGQPNKGDCVNSIYDHDLKPQALVYPLVGRAFTSKRLGLETIRMQIKNLDNDIASSGFTVAYSVNGQSWVSETINDIIPDNGILNYSFQTPFDFSAPGNYSVRLAVTNPADLNHTNDTLLCTVRHIVNAPISLSTGAADSSESSKKFTYAANYTGLDGLDRFDYETPSANLSFRVSNGIVFDYSQSVDALKPQILTANYNLSLFDTAQQAAELQFSYYHSSNCMSAFDSLLIRGSDASPWILVQDLLPPDSPRYVNKQFHIPVTDYLKSRGQNFSSSFQVRWSLSSYLSTIIMDDVKLVNVTNDVDVISIDSLRPYSCNLSNAVPVYITVQNNHNAAVSNVPVKYRINKGNVVTETIASIPAFTTVSYPFKQKADLSSMSDYTIEAWTENANDAFHSNDSSSKTLRNHPLITSFPFIEDFEKSNGGFYTSGTNSSWEWGTPSSSLITGAASGSHAWKTNLDGIYNTPEFSQLYTACFDFSKLSKPVISMSIAMNTDSCSLAYCDAMNFQYSINGKDWRAMPLRSVNNWQQQFTSRQYYRWHVVSERTMDTLTIVQFRFSFRSDAYNSFEGIGIDDIHIYDSTTTIYERVSTEVKENFTTAQKWTEFKKDNKLIAALQSQSQSVGPIQLQTYLYNGPVRNFDGQYYLNRNFVFKPIKPLNDSITLRLYFTDKESDSLLFAGNCNSCTLPKNAYRFGISYYKSSDTSELDNSILNNRKGEWDFIPNTNLRIVPFMTGYYVEFKVKDAGEFRLSNGGLDSKSDLPVQVNEFSTERILSNVNLKWSTAQEINIHHFEIEVAKGNEAFQSDQFEKIDEVASKGRSAIVQSYSFSDNTPDKKGIRYYRLKNIDAFGNYSYSKVMPAVFDDELEWQVFPNPSNGKFNLLYQSVPGSTIHLRIINSVGQQFKEMSLAANGFVQKQEIDLSKNVFANGIYILQIRTDRKTHVLRLVKQ